MNDSRLTNSIFGGDDEHAHSSQGDLTDPGLPRVSREDAAAADSAPASAPARAGEDSGTQHVRAPRGPRGRRSNAPADLSEDERRDRRTEKVPQMSRGKAGTSCLVLLLVMVLGLGAGGYALLRVLGKVPSIAGGSSQQMPDYSGEGTGSVTITIQPGDSGTAIGKTLESAGVVKSASTFAAVAGTNAQFSKIQAGTYKLHRQMSSLAAINLILDPASKTSGGIVIREGLWADEIYQALSKGTGVPLTDYKKVDPNTLGLPAEAGGNPEGYLFPATYTFPKGTSAQQQLKTLVAQGNQTRAQLNIPAGKLKDTLTTASIVQAEASGDNDLGKVARVIDNRLQPDNSETHGRLQMDSTIHFIEKKRGSSKVSIEQTKVNSPYNTYQNPGLPPGPINNPGLAAMKAALNPTPGTWFYFVTVNMDTGETLFADTLSEQNANEAKYRQWCNDHQGRC